MDGNGASDDDLKRSCVIRLRGLPFSATEKDISSFFTGLEIVPDGIVIQLNFQGRSTGQAFVQFTDAEQANRALERNRQHIGSRYIEVYKGHMVDMEGALRMLGRGRGSGSGMGGTGAPASAPSAASGGSGGSGGSGAGGFGMTPFLSTTPGMAAGAGSGVPGSGGSTDLRYTGVVRMRGMPYSTTAVDITAFFKGMSIAKDGILLLSHNDGRPSGEAFVEFVDEETASRAMQLHREPMGSRYVELFRSTKGEMMAAVNQRMYNGAFGGAMTGGFMNPGMMAFGVPGMSAANMMAMQQMAAYGNMTAALPGQAGGIPQGALQSMPLGAAAQAVATGGGIPNDNVCIKMRGLPFSATTVDIVEFFRGYGVVDNGVHIVMGPGERPTGEAYVEFGTPEDAQRAMEKHRQHVGSRYVELFRVSKSEALVAVQGASMVNFNMAAAMDPNMQLLILQQQQLQAAAALGMGGTGGGLPPSGWGGMGRQM